MRRSLATMAGIAITVASACALSPPTVRIITGPVPACTAPECQEGGPLGLYPYGVPVAGMSWPWVCNATSPSVIRCERQQ